MTDMEKVLMGLECLATDAVPCTECPYCNQGFCPSAVARDAIELLKEQEPVKPIDQGDDSYDCDNCGETVGWEELDVFGIDPVKYKYCPGCGRRLVWDE